MEWIFEMVLTLILFLLYSILFAFLMITRSRPGYKKYYTLAKTFNSIGFIVVAVVCGFYGENVGRLVHLLPALILCLIGDVALGVYNTHKQREDSMGNKRAKASIFICGLIAFFFAHVCFVYAFSLRQSLEWIDFIFPLLAIFVTIGLSGLDGMNLGKLILPVTAYSFMVALLCSKGIHLAWSQFTVTNLLLGMGAVLFFISDALILFLYFYKRKYPIVHIANLATYYYAMFLIALSLLY